MNALRTRNASRGHPDRNRKVRQNACARTNSLCYLFPARLSRAPLPPKKCLRPQPAPNLPTDACQTSISTRQDRVATAHRLSQSTDGKQSGAPRTRISHPMIGKLRGSHTQSRAFRHGKSQPDAGLAQASETIGETEPSRVGMELPIPAAHSHPPGGRSLAGRCKIALHGTQNPETARSVSTSQKSCHHVHLPILIPQWQPSALPSTFRTAQPPPVLSNTEKTQIPPEQNPRNFWNRHRSQSPLRKSHP